MSRVKSPAIKRHRKIWKEARGYKQSRSRRVKTAKDAILHAGQYAYAGRKLKKRDLRKLWIIRINAAVREHNLNYNQFINLLKKSKIELDRKILSDLAIKDSKTFKAILDKAKNFTAS